MGCTDCNGQGVVIEMRQIALGMVQQVQRRCTSCGGTGYKFQAKKERKVLEVGIDKGMKHNSKIVFRGLGDEKPNMEPGDIVFVVQEKDHDVYKRKGADLLITKTLSLNEAICGFEWSVNALDGRQLVIKSQSGEVIKPEADNTTPFVKVVANEGMPSLGNPFVKGNLYVLFRVEFPKDNELSQNLIDQLKNILPNPSMSVDYTLDDENVEECYLDRGDVKAFGKGGAPMGGSDAYDSDDGEDGQGGVQCQ